MEKINDQFEIKPPAEDIKTLLDSVHGKEPEFRASWCSINRAELKKRKVKRKQRKNSRRANR